MTKQLKLCPFCGGEATFQRYHTTDNVEFWFVQCSECKTTNWYTDTQEQSVLTWNTRDNLIRKAQRKLKRLVKRLAHYASEWSERK